VTGLFTKKDRFLSKYDYRSMKSGSKRLVGRCVCVDYRPSTHSRLGITASGKFGSSVERNRFKRLVREAFRAVRHELPPLDIHIVPRQLAKTAKLVDITTELNQLLNGAEFQPT
jgi:ribonuclease P protein component